jgi:hypothetical protein
MSEQGSEVTDDAYITFVYARNLAEGHGLRFNANDLRPVEGFSSPSHVLITAATLRARLDPLEFTRGLGLVAFLTVPLAFALAIGRSVGGPIGPTLCITLVCWAGMAFLPDTGAHLISGMETMLFTAVLAWFGAWSVAGLRQARWSRTHTLVGAILALMISQTRPEGTLLAAGTLGALAVVRWLLTGRSDIRDVLTVLGLLALFYGGCVAWKLLYFGAVLPTPYYVKAHNAIFGSAGKWLPGLWYVAGFLQAGLLPPVVLTVALACALNPGRKMLLAAATMLLTPTVIVLAYSRSIHETATNLRYEYPFLIPFALCVAICVRALWDKNRRAATCVLLVMAYGVYFLGAVRPSMVLRWSTAPLTMASAWARTDPDNAWSRMGADLGKTGLGQRATILLSAAGQIPYFSRFFTIDWIGLNTERLSGRHRLDLGEVWKYIESFEPDVVYSFLPPADRAAQSPELDPGFRSGPVQRMLTTGLGGELFRHWDPGTVRGMFGREML